jgi:coenzyme PQQ biosynthesis protein PqqD
VNPSDFATRALNARTMRPKLVSKARLQFDRHANQHLLVYPEKGLALNATAAEVLSLCTGELALDAIIDQLAASHAGVPRDRIEREALALLDELSHRGLIEDNA